MLDYTSRARQASYEVYGERLQAQGLPVSQLLGLTRLKGRML